MRRRDLHSITLKLAELKEYDAVRAEYAAQQKASNHKELGKNIEHSNRISIIPSKNKKDIEDRNPSGSSGMQ